MKTLKYFILILATLAAVFNFASASAQEASDNTSIEARYMGLAQKLGNTSFTAVVKEGKLTCYRHKGGYIGFAGAANFKKLNEKNVVNPNAAAIIGYQGNHFHAEVRAGANQFEYQNEKKFGLQTDLGIYYDILPLKGSKVNVYIGGFVGYQAVKFTYTKEACTDDQGNAVPKTTTNYDGNSLRYGGEVGITIRAHYTNHIGVYGRVYSYNYKAGGNSFQPTVAEVGMRLTFGFNRKVKY